MTNTHPLWILFIYGEEMVWNLEENGQVHIYHADTDIRANWNAGDAMAYYPLSC